MKFLLHISAAPAFPLARAAVDFADAVVAQNHELCGLFFSGEAVNTFNTQTCGNTELLAGWQNLLEKLDIKAQCCSSASARHLDKRILPAVVEIAGLGQLIDLSNEADRVVCFGSRG